MRSLEPHADMTLREVENTVQLMADEGDLGLNVSRFG